MTQPTKSFQNKKAFITGSSRGIGKAIALELARQGSHILLHYNKNKDAALEAQKELQNLGIQTWLYQADLTDLNQTQTMLDQIVHEHQTLDIFIANAASTTFRSLLDLKPDHLHKTFDLVIGSFILCMQKLNPLLKNRDAQVLTISGIDTTNFCPGHGLLASAKSALETLSKYFAVELASDKIHVKCLNPGLVASDSTRFYLGDAFQKICDHANQIAPDKGFVEPQAVAKLVALLLKPEFDWLATQTIQANGGLSFMLAGFDK